MVGVVSTSEVPCSAAAAQTPAFGGTANRGPALLGANGWRRLNGTSCFRQRNAFRKRVTVRLFSGNLCFARRKIIGGRGAGKPRDLIVRAAGYSDYF